MRQALEGQAEQAVHLAGCLECPVILLALGLAIPRCCFTSIASS